ncbi:hypothetical protein F4823DRAFT_567278 [Ustulina deusta]|nr:hypothetical protein F4823DRAFT_567278 [Ustulina deusta]
MAIIQGLPGLEVTIYTNGCIATEYDDLSRVDNVLQCPKVVTKYIECKDNEQFRIHVKVTEEYSWGFENHFLNFAAVIDGVWAAGELCRQEDATGEGWERDISCRVAKNPNGHRRYVVQEFAFSNIVKVDNPTNEQHQHDMKRIERLGTIKVEVYRLTEGGDEAICIPAGDHPGNYTVSREAARGKTQSHGTNLQQSLSTSDAQGLARTTGPLLSFDSSIDPEALKLEGIVLHPQDLLDQLVETSDVEKNNGELCNSEEWIRKPCRRITSQAAEQIADDVIKDLFTSFPARFVDTLGRSASQAVPRRGTGSNRGAVVRARREMQDGSSVPGITLADERPLDKTGVRKNSPFITSDDGDEDDKSRKPSVVHADDDYNADDDEIPEIKTEARTKTMARLKSNKTILKHNIISQAGGEYYHERMQRLQVLREEFCRIRREVMHKASKREFNDIIEGPVCLPRPFKMAKTYDSRQAVDLTGSD